MAQAFGIRVSQAGTWHAVLRASWAAESTYCPLVGGGGPGPGGLGGRDRVEGGRILRWLWVFATVGVVVYRIAPGRGIREAAGVLTERTPG